MAIDTEAKRRATLGLGVVALVLPVPTGSGADTPAERGAVSFTYAANVVGSEADTVSLRLDFEFGLDKFVQESYAVDSLPSYTATGEPALFLSVEDG